MTTDNDTVQACPACDSSQIYLRVTHRNTDRYVKCETCGATAAEPVERPPKKPNPGSGISHDPFADVDHTYDYDAHHDRYESRARGSNPATTDADFDRRQTVRPDSDA